MLLSSRDNKDLLVVSFTDVRRCLESGFMDLDQQAEQAQQKQTVNIAGHGGMHGPGQGQGNDPYSTGAANHNTRTYQPNSAAAGAAVLYPTATPGPNVPGGGRGGLVTYPLPSSSSSSNLKNSSASFTPSGGRGGQGQGQRMGYGQQAQGSTSSSDFSYTQQSQSQFPAYNATSMQSQTQYQQSNSYSQQGQAHGQQYGSQQQPYY